jgi:predicted nuclease of predicted toxin-antitoxin system
VRENGKPLIVLLDEGAPILAADPFLNHGHRVIYHSDVLDSGTNDNVVVATAILNNSALLAIDSDIKRMVKRFGSPNNSERYARLNLIFIACNETLAAKRIAHAMSCIENEWNISCGKAARRLWLDICPHRLTSHR